MLSASRVSNHVTLERAYPIVTTRVAESEV